MYNAHKNLNCTDADFNAIVEILVSTLSKCGVD